MSARILTHAFAFAIAPSIVFAVLPQAGDYEGSVSGARVFYDGQRESVKEPVTLSIQANGNFTLTGTTLSASGVGVYGSLNGALTSADGNSTTTIPLQFSTKGKVKGTLHVVKDSQYFIDAKVSLKLTAKP